MTPATAGQPGSYALVGVLVGAPVAGSVGGILGRRKVMLFACAWFSAGMATTALTSPVAAFGTMRFLTGLGVGALVAATAALVSEYAPDIVAECSYRSRGPRRARGAVASGNRSSILAR